MKIPHSQCKSIKTIQNKYAAEDLLELYNGIDQTNFEMERRSMKRSYGDRNIITDCTKDQTMENDIFLLEEKHIKVRKLDKEQSDANASFLNSMDLRTVGLDDSDPGMGLDVSPQNRKNNSIGTELPQVNDSKPHICNEAQVVGWNDNPDQGSFVENSHKETTSNKVKVELDKCSVSSSVDERGNMFVGILDKKSSMLELNVKGETESFPENNDKGITERKMEEFGMKESSSSSSRVDKDNLETRTIHHSLGLEEEVRNISGNDQTEENVYSSELNASTAENMIVKLNKQREKQSKEARNCFSNDADICERNLSVGNMTSPTDHVAFDVNAVGAEIEGVTDSSASYLEIIECSNDMAVAKLSNKKAAQGISFFGDNGCNDPVSKESNQEHIKDIKCKDKSQMVNGGAVWDIFRRQDVPKIIEYLEKHRKEFRHIDNHPVNSVSIVAGTIVFLVCFLCASLCWRAELLYIVLFSGYSSHS